MTKNLNVGTFTTITASSSSTDPNIYTHHITGIQKWCIGGTGTGIFSSNEANCNTYGGLYEWWEMICGGYCYGKMTPARAEYTSLSSESQLAAYGAVMVPGTTKVQGICPDGWHIPSDAEWNKLAKVATNWSIQLGGCRSNNGFYQLDSYSYWWSSTPCTSTLAYYRYLDSSARVSTPLSRYNHDRSHGFSVRCIRN